MSWVIHWAVCNHLDVLIRRKVIVTERDGRTEAEVEMIRFKDEGRSHEPRTVHGI